LALGVTVISIAEVLSAVMPAEPGKEEKSDDKGCKLIENPVAVLAADDSLVRS